jgi:hypothetical protein
VIEIALHGSIKIVLEDKYLWPGERTDHLWVEQKQVVRKKIAANLFQRVLLRGRLVLFEL